MNTPTSARSPLFANEFGRRSSRGRIDRGQRGPCSNVITQIVNAGKQSPANNREITKLEADAPEW